MQGSAGLVLLALIREVALNDIERLSHAFVKMCWNHRAGLHIDVQNYRSQRVIRIADPQRNVALTREGEAICLELTVKFFLIDHDTGSCFSRSPPADLMGPKKNSNAIEEKQSPIIGPLQARKVRLSS